MATTYGVSSVMTPAEYAQWLADNQPETTQDWLDAWWDPHSGLIPTATVEFATGVWNSTRGGVVGAWEAVTDPIGTIEAVWMAVTNPLETAEAIIDDYAQKMQSVEGRGEITGDVLNPLAKLRLLNQMRKAQKLAKKTPDGPNRVDNTPTSTLWDDGCFVAGTQVHLAEEGNGIWLAAAGILGAGGIARAVQPRRRRKSGGVPSCSTRCGTPSDENWALLKGQPDGDGHPSLSPQELDRLCEQLLMGEDAEADGELTTDSEVIARGIVPAVAVFESPRMASEQTATRRRNRPRDGWLGSVAMLLLAAACLVQELRPAASHSKPIDQITVGERVLAQNPTSERDFSLGLNVDAAAWRRIELRAPKRDGSVAGVTLLRPLAWLDERNATVGGTVHISVPECGIDGNAEVLAIGPCPPVDHGTGRVVTAVFRHSSAQIVDLHVAGLPDPIGTTANHPFWSEDRREFVRADALQPGERLRTRAGTSHVERVAARPGRQPVYNIEVQLDHVYHGSCPFYAQR